MLIDGKEHEVGMDVGTGDSVSVEKRYSPPSAEYPHGSWLYKIGDEVTVATGYFAIEHPASLRPTGIMALLSSFMKLPIGRGTHLNL